MQAEEEQNKAIAKDMLEVTSRLDKMTSDLGSKAVGAEGSPFGKGAS